MAGFVPGLHKRLAAADLAVVQGGLTTTTELTAARRYGPVETGGAARAAALLAELM
jgi:hypothetical protein